MTDPLRTLQQIIKSLRDPETGCPWDREQTHRTLRPYLIEEAYEVVEAIEEYPEKLDEELGDVLLQVYLHAQIAEEDGRFSLDSIAEKLLEKLIRRHPHVFGTVKVETAEDVKKTWEAVKETERGEQKQEHLLSSLPGHLPALLEAYKIGNKVAPKNFDWDVVSDVMEKVREELGEVEEEILRETPDAKRIEEEVGDLLFAVAQLGRKLGMEPEAALKAANRKFTKRFEQLENIAWTEHPEKDLSTIPRALLEEYWQRVKAKE